MKAPRRRHPQSGVLVVGLGEYGELTPLRLVSTVRQALISHALDEADRDDGDGPLELEIASVLLGATGDQGLSVSASVRAIVTAVREANRELAAGEGPARARYRGLRLWERTAAEAELALGALLAFGDGAEVVDGGQYGDTALDPVVAVRDLGVAAGAMDNTLRVDADEEAWWRVRISEVGGVRTAKEPGEYLELEFSVGGRLARTGNVVHRVERRRLERLLRSAVADPAPRTGLHTTLFELLFPNQLKWDLMAAQDVQLEVDDVTADIPWEMLAARNPEHDTRGQLALRAPMVRQLRLDDHPTVRRATRPTAHW